AGPRLDLAADEVVPIKRAFGQRREPLDRNAQLQARKRLGSVHHVHARDRDHRPLVLKPDGGEHQPRDPAASLDEWLGPHVKPPLGKVGLAIDDHLAAPPVRASNASDVGHLFPLGWRGRNAYCPPALYGVSRISNVTVLPSFSLA